ncbi:hypothetical protein [Brevibacillus sp. 179-C 1.1 NHS]|uniref:hypothetical protein n=1 Tax=Brevibacillus sp. 179-C 1.1 NHS TaxID=3235177 RepID=UPI0039A2DECF
MNGKQRVVKAKITRTVTEIATVILDRAGNIEEIQDIHERSNGTMATYWTFVPF